MKSAVKLLEVPKERNARKIGLVNKDAASEILGRINEALEGDRVAVLPPASVEITLKLVRALQMKFDTIMLDPWYNKGFGGMQEDYMPFFLNIIKESGDLADHVYFWGFPEIIAPFVERISAPLKLTCWLTWYYKNNPSVIRGWRSAQNACLHLSRPDAILHPERFLNEKQIALKERGKLRYMPGPTSVLEDKSYDVMEEPLLVGFVGRKEQTGHPSQKPQKVYDHLLQMTMSDGGILLDPLAGSGTAGAVSVDRNFRAVLCDRSDEYTQLIEKRLDVKRLDIESEVTALIGPQRQ